MTDKSVAEELRAVKADERGLRERLQSGARVEVFFTPEDGLELVIEGQTELLAREVILAATTHSGSELKLRLRLGDEGGVVEWADFVIQNARIYLTANKENRKGS